jgi:hypothetical protein
MSSGEHAPGRDEFPIEKQAQEIAWHLEELLHHRPLPLSKDFQGTSPMPVGYRNAADGVLLAEFDPADRRFVDFRNIGRQDLIVVTALAPLLFLRKLGLLENRFSTLVCSEW